MTPRDDHEAKTASFIPVKLSALPTRVSDLLIPAPAYKWLPSDHSTTDFLNPPTEPGDLGRLGHYRILKKIGEGGMGLVFHAIDTELSREVAVKVIRREFSSDDAEKRFESEARATAKIEHDHVVKLNRFGRVGQKNVLCLEMPLLRGQSLHTRLRRAERLPLTDVLKIGREMAEGLAAAHAAGLIHRDVKPANVFLSVENCTWRVRLLDLGLCRESNPNVNLTNTGAIAGTPAYMSPEQADGRSLDARSDLFSLGLVLYHLLTNDNPFDAGTLTATLQRIGTLVPPTLEQICPEVPAELSRLIERLMAKTPADRPASAHTVADEMKHLQDGLPANAPPTLPIRPQVHRRLRRRLLLAVVLGTTAALVLAGALLFWLRNGTTAKVPAAPLALQLSLQAKKRGRDGLLSLDAPNVLPLQAGDALRIEAKTARPAYFYVLNLTADGKVTLLYPWRDDGDWESIIQEKRRDFYSIPDPDEEKDVASKLEAGPSGIESVVVLARETPLTAAEREKLRNLLRTWPVDQGKFDPLLAAVTIGEDEFRFGDARDEKERGKIKRNDVVELDDPVLRLRRLLQGEVRALRVASRGVCYTFQGK